MRPAHCVSTDLVRCDRPTALRPTRALRPTSCAATDFVRCDRPALCDRNTALPPTRALRPTHCAATDPPLCHRPTALRPTALTVAPAPLITSNHPTFSPSFHLRLPGKCPTIRPRILRALDPTPVRSSYCHSPNIFYAFFIFSFPVQVEGSRCGAASKKQGCGTPV